MTKTKRPVKLLSGGNPQIAKGDGAKPVKAYYAALPGWKKPLGKRVHALIMKAVPKATLAVKWNTPMYGTGGAGFFVGVHAFTKFLRLTFFDGTSLEPMPPGTSKTPKTRYLDLYEAEPLDTAQLTKWIKQASKLPGWAP